MRAIVLLSTDGGATWAQVAPYPVVEGPAGLSFANTTTGFAGGCPQGGSIGSPLDLCVTQDASSSWSALSSPIPPGYVKGNQLGAELPVFTSTTPGVLEVASLSGPSSSVAPLPLSHEGCRYELATGPAIGVPLVGLRSSVLSTGEVFVAPTVSGQVALINCPLGLPAGLKSTPAGALRRCSVVSCALTL